MFGFVRISVISVIIVLTGGFLEFQSGKMESLERYELNDE